MINWSMQGLKANEEGKQIDALGDFLMEEPVDTLGSNAGLTSCFVGC